eukprot:1196299-Prorocentrum_minimum.AAC.3
MTDAIPVRPLACGPLSTASRSKYRHHLGTPTPARAPGHKISTQEPRTHTQVSIGARRKSQRIHLEHGFVFTRRFAVLGRTHRFRVANPPDDHAFRGKQADCPSRPTVQGYRCGK